MLELKLTKRMLALGLFVVLSTYNFAYANTTVNGDHTTPPRKEEPKTPNGNASIKTTTTNSTTTTPPGKTAEPSNRKKKSSGKPPSSAVSGCLCSSAPATGRAGTRRGPWWDCTRGCLRSWGVSIVQLTICGVSCASGNIPICAVCLGVDVSVLMLCSIGCSVYAGTSGNPHNQIEPILVRNKIRNNKQKAERLVLSFAARK